MTRLIGASALALALFACQAATEQNPGGSGAGGTGGVGGNPGGSGGTGGTGGTGGQVPGQDPTLTSAEAAVTGRTGKDITLTLIGGDPDKNLLSAVITVLDAAGGEVLAFDADLDGQFDSAETSVFLEGDLSQATVLATASLPRLFSRFPAIARLEIALEDDTGRRSPVVTASLTAQPVKSMGEPCDAEFLRDRCADSLGCRGEPSTCQEGTAPTVTRAAYYSVDGGARVLVEGLEPEADLDSLTIEFLDAGNQPVSVDQDGDGQADGDTFVAELDGYAETGAYFYAVEPGGDFVNQVVKLAVTPADTAGHVGTRTVATRSALPVRSAGQSCDPRGFDVCGTNLVCTPGVIGERNVCQAPSTLRPRICGAAPQLDPFAGVTTAVGTAQGGSAWDPPAGCAVQEPKNRPEGVVRVKLTQPAAELTVTTAVTGTTFDTIVYLVEGCTDEVLMCNDDSGGAVSSTLSLTSVPAGDYVVIVDSWDAVGGRFALEVTAR